MLSSHTRDIKESNIHVTLITKVYNFVGAQVSAIVGAQVSANGVFIEA